MSWALFKANIKANRTIWIIMTIIFFFYFTLMVSMYDPDGLVAWEDMLAMVPEGFLQAVGWDMIGTSLLSVLGTTMYGFLIFLFPLVISIVVNHRLMATHIDKGSMAFLLATPNSRIKIAATQGAFSLASITVFFTLVAVLGSLIAEGMFPGELEAGKFILLNFYALLLYYTIGGIGFFASCIANESKHSLGLGIGLPAAFLILKMLGNSGDKISWIGNLSLFNLFSPEKLVEGSSFIWIGMISFAVLAAALYIGGIAIFHKRDLHV